jgi:hypothetical protein
VTKVAVKYDAPPTVAAFLASGAFVRCIVGPVGSGKSSGCCIEILRRASEQARGTDGKRRTRFAVIRNSYRELEDTTRKTFEEWIPQSLGRWREADMTFELKYLDVHAEILFRALDRPEDVRKLLSLELTGAYLNEAKEIPRAVFDMLTGRVGCYPSKMQGGPTWFGIWMDTNPPDTDHWIYRLFEEARPEGHEVYRQPSGLAPDAENVENLPPGYYARMCAGKTADVIIVYVKGQYGFVKDGKPIYPEWQDTLHVADVKPERGFGVVLLGQDFGLTPAAVLAQRDPSDGQIQVFAELVSEDMGAVNFARELATKLKREHGGRYVRGWGDPAGEQRAQTDEKTPYMIFREQGVPIAPAPTNDFTLRREAIGGLLQRLTLKGRPALVISPRCTTLRKGMAGGYCFKRVQVSGDDRYQDKPDKNRFSHVCEALQYLAVGEGEDRRAVRGVGSTEKVEPSRKVKRALHGWS